MVKVKKEAPALERGLPGYLVEVLSF